MVGPAVGPSLGGYIVDHYAWRTRVKGIADELETLYGGVESWEVEPWFPADVR